MKTIQNAKIESKSTLVKEHSSGLVEQLGSHDFTMELFVNKSNQHGVIEWDIPAIEETKHIGVWWDEKCRLTEYDGVFDLPKEAIKLLNKAGITVPKEFRD